MESKNKGHELKGHELVVANYRFHQEREKQLYQRFYNLTGELETVRAELRSINKMLKRQGKLQNEPARRSRYKIRAHILRTVLHGILASIKAIADQLKYVRGELARHEGAVYTADSPTDLIDGVLTGRIPATKKEILIAKKIKVLNQVQK